MVIIRGGEGGELARQRSMPSNNAGSVCVRVLVYASENLRVDAGRFFFVYLPFFLSVSFLSLSRRAFRDDGHPVQQKTR